MDIVFMDNRDKEELGKSLDSLEVRVRQQEEQKPLVLYADRANEYVGNAAMGDDALNAILRGRQILVRVPNADGGRFTAVYSPIYFYQLPNYSNQYLYLFYLNDGVDANGLPSYGQLKLLLSKEYNETPLI